MTCTKMEQLSFNNLPPISDGVLEFPQLRNVGSINRFLMLPVSLGFLGKACMFKRRENEIRGTEWEGFLTDHLDVRWN